MLICPSSCPTQQAGYGWCWLYVYPVLVWQFDWGVSSGPQCQWHSV